MDTANHASSPLLPSLTNVKGGFNVQSEQQIDCSGFQSEAGSGKVIQGTFTCKTTADASSIGSSTSSSSSASATSSKGAAASYSFSEVAAGISVLGGLLQMLL